MTAPPPSPHGAVIGAPDTTPVKLNAPVIRFALRVIGSSQSALARRIDVHESTISRALAGEPTTNRVAGRLLDAFPGLKLQEIVEVPGFPAPLPPGAVDEPVD